jgi:hypothetical protein
MKARDGGKKVDKKKQQEIQGKQLILAVLFR